MEYRQTYREMELLWEPAMNYVEQEIKFVNLLDDLGFKHVFGRDENKEILIAFLNEIIPDKQIIDLEHIRNEQIPSDPATKASVFDLYCETQDGSRIVVELQREEQFDYVDRAIYYGAFPVQNQIEKGKKRYTFSAVYVINILNFNLVELKEDSKPVSTFRLKILLVSRSLSLNVFRQTYGFCKYFGSNRVNLRWFGGCERKGAGRGICQQAYGVLWI